MRRILTYCACILVCALCSSCFTIRWVETAPDSLDVRAKAFSASSDTSNIYVIYLGSGWCVRAIFLDGAEVGVLDKRRYRLLEVTPGKHSIAEGWSTAHQTVTLITEAGRNYFVCITEHGAAWLGHQSYTIEIVGDDEGRNLVSKLKLAGQWRSGAGVEHSR
jgi:hypothetical protein